MTEGLKTTSIFDLLSILSTLLFGPPPYPTYPAQPVWFGPFKTHGSHHALLLHVAEGDLRVLLVAVREEHREDRVPQVPRRLPSLRGGSVPTGRTCGGASGEEAP